MAAVARGRCFARPSGTEDVVRIYAEAATQVRTSTPKPPLRLEHLRRSRLSG